MQKTKLEQAHQQEHKLSARGLQIFKYVLHIT